MKGIVLKWNKGQTMYHNVFDRKFLLKMIKSLTNINDKEKSLTTTTCF